MSALKKTSIVDSDEKLRYMFDALGDASRFQIFKLLLRRQNICVSDIAENLGITVSAVSQHLKILELSGLTVKKRNGQMICYEAKRADTLVRCLIKFFV